MFVMLAKDGVKYALLRHGKIINIFTKEFMSEWNEKDIHVVEIPKELENDVKVYDEYRNNEFIIVKRYKPLDISQYPNDLFAVVKYNRVSDIVNKEKYQENITHNSEVYKDFFVIPIPKDKEMEIKIDSIYNIESKEFEISLEELKKIYLEYSNNCYESISNHITNSVNVTEMLSWTLQENEARNYKKTKDKSKANFITQLAKARSMDVDLLADKILEKSDIYQKHISQLLGYKHKLDSQIESASSEEEVRNAKFDMSIFLSNSNV